jgi:hypothetical protein
MNASYSAIAVIRQMPTARSGNPFRMSASGKNELAHSTRSSPSTFLIADTRRGEKQPFARRRRIRRCYERRVLRVGLVEPIEHVVYQSANGLVGPLVVTLVKVDVLDRGGKGLIEVLFVRLDVHGFLVLSLLCCCPQLRRRVMLQEQLRHGPVSHTNILTYDIEFAIHRLSHRPRKCLDFKTPHEVFKTSRNSYTRNNTPLHFRLESAQNLNEN